MRMLTGFLPPTDGTAVIAGHDIFERSHRGAAGRRLSARDAAALSGDVGGLLSRLTWRSIKDVPRRGQRREAVVRRPWSAAVSPHVHRQRDRYPLEGLPPARRARPGHRPRSRRADPRRAHRGSRSAPDPRDPQTSSCELAAAREGRGPAHGHPLHAHPSGGGGHLPPGGPDQRGAARWWTSPSTQLTAGGRTLDEVFARETTRDVGCAGGAKLRHEAR